MTICEFHSIGLAAVTDYVWLPFWAQKVLIKQRQQVFEVPYKDTYQLNYLIKCVWPSK